MTSSKQNKKDSVTFKELEKALAALKFNYKLIERESFQPRLLESTPEKIIIFRHGTKDFIIPLPFQNFQSNVQPGDFDFVARQLYLQGVIEKKEDLSNMIVKNRKPEPVLAA